MSKGMLAAAALGLATAALASLPGEARAQSHWFYGNYAVYDGEVYFPQPRRHPPYAYYPAYPRPWFWRGHPNEIVEYQVAPGEWIRVYPDGRQEPLTRKRRKLVDPSRPPKTRQAARPAAKEAVPLPKAKPANSASSLAKAPAMTGSALESATAALELPEPEAAPQTRQVDPLETGSLDRQGSLKAVSCEEAEKIVSDFGFSDVKATGCSGGTYEVEALRDGQPYTIKLSAASGELTEVKKR